MYLALQLVPREKQRHAYLNAVKKRYKHLPEINRIDRYQPFSFFQSLSSLFRSQVSLFQDSVSLPSHSLPFKSFYLFQVSPSLCDAKNRMCRFCRHRHLPKPIYKASKLRHAAANAERTKEKRKRDHSAPGSIKSTPARKKRIVAEVE